jgi:hypothetical protein
MIIAVARPTHARVGEVSIATSTSAFNSNQSSFEIAALAEENSAKVAVLAD